MGHGPEAPPREAAAPFVVLLRSSYCELMETPADPSPPRPGRAFAVYSALRLALLLVCMAVLLAIGLDGLVAVGGGVLLSAVLSLVLLRRQRDDFTAASVARTQQRRAERADRRARLDGTESTPS